MEFLENTSTFALLPPATASKEIATFSALAMRASVLFIPASIRSHVLPALYLADLLAPAYEVFFTVTNSVLEELVNENGYLSIRSSGYRVLIGQEGQFIQEHKNQKPNALRIARAYWQQEVGQYRQRELDALIARLQPSTIIMDVFSNMDYLLLAGRYPDILLLFFNPMLSRYRVSGYPIVLEGTWMQGKLPATPRPSSLINWKNAWKHPLDGAMQYLMDRSCEQTLRQSRVPREAIDFTNPLGYTIRGVPELILAPLEFEFAAEVKQPEQQYLGLCTRPQRQDTELDPYFETRWQVLLEHKRNGDQLVYCSFGTYYTGPDQALIQFLENLLEALRPLTGIQLVCSVNRFVVELFQARYPDRANVSFFSRVPQLRVLQQTAVFITHGGLGSVKEAIEYQVPMLAYPLDLKYDQPGNAFKIEHHGLGLRGNFQFERVADLQSKVSRLLTDARFRQNLANLRTRIVDHYSDEQNLQLLEGLMGQTIETKLASAPNLA